MKHVNLFVNPVWDPTGERRDQHHHPRRQIVKGFDHGSLKPFKGSPKSDHGSLSSLNHYLSIAAFASAEELFNLIVFRHISGRHYDGFSDTNFGESAQVPRR